MLARGWLEVGLRLVGVWLKLVGGRLGEWLEAGGRIGWRSVGAF